MAVRSLAQSSLVEPFSTNSMLAGYESNYFHHLETVRLSSTATEINFVNLQRYADFQHLQIRMVARNYYTANDRGYIHAQFNGDAGANYKSHFLYGNGSSVSSFTGGTNELLFADFPYVPSAGSEYGSAVIDILDPFDTNKNTTTRSLGGNPNIAGFNRLGLTSGGWFSTAAVTSIRLFPGTWSFYSGSRFSLYGIKARS